jgi:hypothetical protein
VQIHALKSGRPNRPLARQAWSTNAHGHSFSQVPHKIQNFPMKIDGKQQNSIQIRHPLSKIRTYLSAPISFILIGIAK